MMCLLYLQCFCINRICPHIYSSVGETPEAYSSRRRVSVCVLEYFSQYMIELTVRHSPQELYSDLHPHSSWLVYSWCVHVLVCVYWSTIKKHFNIDQTGEHPLKLIYQVLKYAWKHKCPENRSAFTYWEEDIPPRIDLGKSKYGGPFTTEEVEDTKTFFSILLLLLSLLGFHLSGHSYSVFVDDF